MREQFSPKSSVLNTTCTTCSATKEEEKRFFFFLEEKTWSWKIFAPFLFSSSLSLSFIFYFEKNDRRSRCFSILHRHWTFLLVQLEPFSCFSFPHPLFLSFDPSFSRVSPEASTTTRQHEAKTRCREMEAETRLFPLRRGRLWSRWRGWAIVAGSLRSQNCLHFGDLRPGRSVLGGPGIQQSIPIIVRFEQDYMCVESV